MYLRLSDSVENVLSFTPLSLHGWGQAGLIVQTLSREVESIDFCGSWDGKDVSWKLFVNNLIFYMLPCVSRDSQKDYATSH